MYRRRSRVMAATWVLGLVLVIAVLPGAGIARAQGIGQASYGGVSFSYDKSLATNVRGQIVPSNVGQGGLVYDVRPQHISFSFDGYPASGVWTPRIRVIPLAEYKAAQAQSSIGSGLSALESYLGGNTGSLPPLPAVNEQRNISEGVTPVAGSGVTGVRFIAVYSQGPAPVTAKDIAYMFIGLTTDHNYYVEATFPVSLSTALGLGPSPLTPESVNAYNAAVAEKLGNAGMMDFTPTLDNLDKMMASMQANSSVIPGMPTTGHAPEYTWLLLAGIAAGLLAFATGIFAWRRARAQ